MDDDDVVIIAVDSTGIKVTNRGLNGCKISGCKKQERLSKDACCSEYQDQRNSCIGSYR